MKILHLDLAKEKESVHEYEDRIISLENEISSQHQAFRLVSVNSDKGTAIDLNMHHLSKMLYIALCEKLSITLIVRLTFCRHDFVVKFKVC